MNVSYLLNLKFIHFIESLFQQVSKMKKLFTLFLHGFFVNLSHLIDV